MRRGLVVLLTFACGQGCASSYQPVKSPRIATVVAGGQPTFVKDGVHFGSQVWGTGLVDAVHGNPQAEHHARVGRNLIAGGFVLSLAGLGSEIGGLAVLIHEHDQHSEAAPSAVAVGLVVGGLIAALTGSALIMAGQPHLYDAINIHNDSVDVPPTTAPLGPRVH
jgi:hypothetical protein